MVARSKSFESELKKLQEIVAKLESGTESLQDSLNLFEEGTKIAKFCHEVLNSAEQKITDLSKVNLSVDDEGEPADEKF